ncbi:putative effector protein A (lepA), substrate of the Dot/Icm secretion system [Legionella hackeliae]|uniref:Putative effector protein A (LepA), substrate of the Dot/Icm secretion system n=2 Tax=Legionella hackeliae TaxID=449 RepID=A0A0A8UZ03_LEGHA|nr:putative effector protein A (lepA), substrate of the Dot/Icm secretion system [Legionella hackeliae]
MTDKIKELLHDLANLQQPYSLESLRLIFEKKKELFVKDVKLNEKYTSHWLVLCDINSEIVEWQRLQAELQKVANLKLEITALSSQHKIIQSRLKKIKTELLQKKGYFNHNAKPLFDTYHSYLLSKTPLLATAIPTHPSQQQRVLSAYLTILEEQLNALVLKTVRLNLADVLHRRRSFSANLKQLNIIVTETSTDAPQIYEKMKAIKARLVHFKTEFAKAQRELTENLSNQEVQKEIEYKLSLIETSKAELLSVGVKIAKSDLGQDIKTMLESDYEIAPNKEEFLIKQQNSLQWTNSAFNLHSWYSWSTNSSFNTDLKRSQAEFNYLQLLHQRGELTSRIKLLGEQLTSTSVLVNQSSTAPNSLIDLKKLQEHILQLFSEYAPNRKLTNVSNVSLVTEIADSLNSLDKRIDDAEKSLQLLEKLIEADSEILELRTNHSLTDETETLIPNNEEIIELRSTELQRQQEILILQEKITLCKTCLSHLAAIIKISSEQDTLRKEKKRLQTEMQLKNASQTQIPDCNTYESRIMQIQDTINLQISSLVTCQNLPTEMEIPIEPENEVNTEFTMLKKYQDDLCSWNSLICSNNQRATPSFQKWYQQLYIALQMHTFDETSCYQACQLLRDIHFELQSPNNDVLTHYQTLCADPQNQWQQLIQFKPPLPLVNDNNELAAVQHPALSRYLQALYEQQQVLEKYHSKESELLLQAIQNLHQGCLLYESNPKHPALQYLISNVDDPRYEILQKHRGFNIVNEWLAKFCSLLFDLIKNQQERTNYRQSFFFKPTKTVKLLQDTKAELISCMVG